MSNMTITSVAYIDAGTAIAITMADGTVWTDDASLPPDTEIRRALAEWIAAGGVITAYPVPPQPSPVEALAALKTAAVNAKREAIIGAGYLADLGAAGTHRLDMRDEGDAVNWLGLTMMAAGLVGSGNGGTTLPLRTAANDTVSAAAADVEAALIAMGQWKSAVMGHSWALKDQIKAATTVAQLNKIDIEVGWPG